MNFICHMLELHCNGGLDCEMHYSIIVTVKLVNLWCWTMKLSHLLIPWFMKSQHLNSELPTHQELMQIICCDPQATSLSKCALS